MGAADCTEADRTGGRLPDASRSRTRWSGVMDLGRGQPVKFGSTSTGPVVGPSGVTGVQESVTGVIVTSPLPDRTPDSNTTPARPKPDPPPPRRRSGSRRHCRRRPRRSSRLRRHHRRSSNPRRRCRRRPRSRGSPREFRCRPPRPRSGNRRRPRSRPWCRRRRPGLRCSRRRHRRRRGPLLRARPRRVPALSVDASGQRPARRSARRPGE